MDPHPPGVSVSGPVNPAIDRMKQILFRPFNFEKWLTIGFCAWLAALGTGGGSGASGRSNLNFDQGASGRAPNLSVPLSRAHDYVTANLAWIVPVGAFLLLLAIIFVIVIFWLQSRGTFMLLHCTVLNRGEVKIPWTKYQREADSLWKFRLGLVVAALIFFVPLLAAGLWLLWDAIGANGHFDSGSMPVLVVIGGAWICLALPFTVVSVFTRHFVAPIMYLKGGTCLDAWRILLTLLEANVVRFICYILFQIVLWIGIALLVIAFILCTCCIGGILLAVPFIGTVVFLPVTISLRCYSLLYLAQYGPEFDLFAAQEPPPILPPPLRL